jgi:hypothetical protein
MSTSVSDPKLDICATSVVVTPHHLTVDLEDGRTISVPLSWYPRLANGTPAEWANFEIGHFGIHWPDLDEDISIKGLLLGHKSGESARSIQRWLEYRARGEKVPVATFPLPEDMARELSEELSQAKKS